VTTEVSAIDQVEIWRNSSKGIASIRVLDTLGRETDKVVRGGQTFQVSARERQMNQWAAASGEQDMFRNGFFTLISPSKVTNMQEIVGESSWTDKAIEEFILQRVGDDKAGEDAGDALDKALMTMSSPVTLDRFKEEAALQKLPAKLRKKIDARLKDVDTRVETTEREIVSDKQVIKTKPERVAS